MSTCLYNKVKLSLFRSHVIKASAAKLQLCKFLPVTCVVVYFCFLTEKEGIHLHSEARE
jgi:hypothetical protein